MDPRQELELYRRIEAAQKAGDARAELELMRQLDGPSRMEQLEAKHGASIPRADPTLDFWSNAVAGVGKAASDANTGLGQLLYGAADQLPGVDLSAQRAALRAQVDETRANDAALMNTGGGIVGNVVGNVGMMMLPGGALGAGAKLARLPAGAGAFQAARSAALPGTLPGAITQGAATGAVMPSGSGDSGVTQADMGAAAGGAGYLLPGALGALTRTTGAVLAPFTTTGAENAAGRLVQRFAADPANLSAIQQSPVPGVRRTLAEATNDIGIGQLQRTIANSDPQLNGRLFAQNEANQAARKAVLEGLAGDPTRMAAAQAARQQASMPALRAAEQVEGVGTTGVVRIIDQILASRSGMRNTVRSALTDVRGKLFEPYSQVQRLTDARAALDAVTSGRINRADLANLQQLRSMVRTNSMDPADALKAAMKIRPTNAKAAEALEQFKAILRRPDQVPIDDVSRLYGVRQHIDDLLTGKAGGEQAGATLARRELMGVKNALDRAIMRQAPEFRQYLQAYTQGSRPINQMEFGRELLRRATDNKPDTGNIYPNAFEVAMNNLDDVARRGTGFKRATAAGVLDPPQQAQLQGLLGDVARSRRALEGGMARGSNTVQNFSGAGILRSITDPLIGTRWGQVVGDSGLGETASSVLSKIYKWTGRDTAIQDVVMRIIQDPSQAVPILARLPPAQRRLVEHQLGQYTGVAGQGGLLALGASSE